MARRTHGYFINTEFRAPLDPAGWKEWNGALKTSTYAEFNSRGQAGDLSKRIAPSKQLTKAELAQYATKTFLGPPDSWNPEKIKCRGSRGDKKDRWQAGKKSRAIKSTLCATYRAGLKPAANPKYTPS